MLLCLVFHRDNKGRESFLKAHDVIGETCLDGVFAAINRRFGGLRVSHAEAPLTADKRREFVANKINFRLCYRERLFGKRCVAPAVDFARAGINCGVTQALGLIGRRLIAMNDDAAD